MASLSHRSLRTSVSTHSIRYRILKEGKEYLNGATKEVSTHSIRYRILKVALGAGAGGRGHGFNPFDPIQDTESRDSVGGGGKSDKFQPIRSDTGY